VAEDKQKEREGNSDDLDTDHVSRQKTSGLGWLPFLPFVLHETPFPYLLEPVGVDINYYG
jgi:hypothetical protein